ncbi:single-strand DNA-binding protein [Leifsonia xyli subsp. cynodontis DSM 46306]|uniref:Single-stranded DNA-binding protein n=1 Tax=Leifsonia xyli subsp. cynodontis DSM 46306 TaxID=1389489 RepID=U3P813_LEIXC|nr:single-stranded DNA-binding protein [Leifsonia xyli]AGW41609.1 single-strand DNA-binding protein [Leifsonia xyli subsp. cynodontis DSM 46306]
MTDNLAVRGLVATEPRHLTTEGGIPITSFRLVITRRRFNRKTSSWEDGESNWFTVSAFRRLAVSAAECVAKGDPVVVSGRLSIREWMGEKRGVTAEIEADAIGHDLAWGRSMFSRTVMEVSLEGGRPEGASRPSKGIPVDSPGVGP